MKKTFIIIKNSALGILGAIIISVIIDPIDIVFIDYVSAFGWGIYIACKVIQEILEIN